MEHIQKSFIVTHNAQQMFDLIDLVEDYPKFLPWCNKTEILNRQENYLEAVVHIDYLSLKHYFATKNHSIYGKEITVSLLKGPFKHLDGKWIFTDLGNCGSKVSFELKYEFSNRILSKLIGPIFSLIYKNIVDAFIKAADKKYGYDHN